MSAMMRSVLMFNGNLGNSLWLMALGGPVGRCVSVMLNKNIYTEVCMKYIRSEKVESIASWVAQAFFYLTDRYVSYVCIRMQSIIFCRCCFALLAFSLLFRGRIRAKGG